jgi:S1-C subfamily serine protease
MNWSNFALVCSFLVCAAHCAASEKASGLYRRAVGASVEILVNGRIAGTGSLVDANGTVLTACHVIRTGDRHEARSSSLKRVPLELICTDRSHDLALLALPERENPYAFLPLAKKIPPEGRPAHLLGTPIFRHRLMLTGFVARREPLFEWYDGAFMEGYPLAGVAAGGTSGGPWLNPKGEIVGVQVAAMTVGGAPQGVVTSPPLKAIRSLCEKRETVVAATMQAAVEELWAQGPGYLADAPKDAKGLVFRQVDATGVAGKAGIKNGDLLLKMGKRPYETVTDFMRTLRRRKPGDGIRLIVSNARGEERRELTITLAELK